MTVFNVSSVKGSADTAARGKYFEGEGVGGGADDYYLKPGSDTVSARFIGGGVGVAGVKEGQSPKPGDYYTLFDGRRIDNGESFLSDNRRKYIDDNESAVRGFSTAFSVDKSLSLFYVASDQATQQKILEALHDAAHDVFNYAEQQGKMVARLGAGGSKGRIVGSIAGTSYAHITNREQEPQLHVHVEIANSIFCEDGSVGTIDAKESLYRRQAEYRALYDVAFYKRLVEAGVETKSFGNDFSGYGLHSNSVTREQIENHSSRRKAILESANKSGYVSAESKQLASFNTRKGKTEILDAVVLHDNWREGLGDIDRESIADRDNPTLLQAEDVLFKGRSVATIKDLERAAAQLAICDERGLGSIEEHKNSLIRELGILLVNEDREEITTKEFVEIEAELLRYAIRQKALTSHDVGEEEIESGIAAFQRERSTKDAQFVLNHEQAASVRSIAAGGGLSVMQGAAGTGKSATLGAVQQIYQDQGYRVLGLAPSGKAAEGLSNDGIESMTMHKFLMQLESVRATIDDQTLLMIDEAGMADTRMLHALCHAAETAGAKVVLVGDAQQLESVGSASIFSMLGRPDAAGHSELLQIARQHHAEDRAIAQAWLKGKEGEAWQLSAYRGQLVAAGKLSTPEDDEDGSKMAARQAALEGVEHIEEATPLGLCAAAYLEDLRRDEAAGGNGSSTMMLADTNADVRALNELVREQRVEAGEVSDEEELEFSFEASKGLSRTERIAPGDRVMFRRPDADRGVTNGTTGRVVGIETRTLDGKPNVGAVVKLDEGGSRFIDLSYKGLEVAYATTVHKSQGVTIKPIDTPGNDEVGGSSHYLASEISSRRSMYVAGTRAVMKHKTYMAADAVKKIKEKSEKFTYKSTATDAVTNAYASIVLSEKEEKVADKATSKPRHNVITLIEKGGESIGASGDDQDDKSNEGIERESSEGVIGYGGGDELEAG